MPPLSRRNARPLLRTVHNRTYATEADHHAQQQSDETRKAHHASSLKGSLEVPGEEEEEQGQTRASKRRRTTRSLTTTAALSGGEKTVGVRGALQRQQNQQQQQPTPPASDNVPTPKSGRQQMEDPEEDLMADPISDLEDDAAAEAIPKPVQAFVPSSRGAFKLPRAVATSKESEEKQDEEDAEMQQGEADDLSGEPAWFRKQVADFRAAAASKKKKTFVNIHAPQPKSAWGARKTLATYTKKAPRVTKTDFKSPRSKAKAKKEKEVLPERKFVQPRGWDDSTDEKENAERRFRVPPNIDTDAANNGHGDDEDEVDSDLSSVPSSPEATNDGNVECPICGKPVDVLLKQAFHDEFFLERHLNFRWQQRFCFYHRRHDAEEAWSRRGYPEIDWNRLDLRLLKFHPHLREVLTGTRPSRHRERLRQKVKKGGKATVHEFQMLDDESGDTVAGYYGPRGEQIMLDHILTHLSDDIRDQAARDKLVAAPGVSGGVAGFVQLVLLPELAERLVAEDLGTDDVRLIEETLRESAEVGTLLHPEVFEKIAADDDDEVEE